MKLTKTSLLIAATSLFVAPLTASASYVNSADGQAFIEELRQEGISPQHVRNVLGQAKRQQKILDAISRPAEGTMTWGRYRNIFMQDQRINQGIQFWQENKETLDAAQAKYGVPPEIITAIVGVETSYGRNTGSWKAIDALATLGFDYPPRAKFFRSELKHLFLLERDAGIDISQVKGSYAGALGMPQFIPSSYRAYAVDGDNDGRVDLISSKADIIHSVANYFAKHKWQADLPVAARANLSNNANVSIFSTDYKPSTTLAAAAKAGATPVSCQQAPDAFCFNLPGNTAVAPLVLDGAQGNEYWLVTDNFYTITRYNHSRLYAMAVFQLSQAIKEKMED